MSRAAMGILVLTAVGTMVGCSDITTHGDGDSLAPLFGDAVTNDSADAVSVRCSGVADCPATGACELVACLEGLCVSGHVAEGTLCTDGDPCTRDDACASGACVGVADDCDDGLPCTSDSCVDGACVHEGFPDCCNEDADCNDNDACTGVGTCDFKAHVCEAGTPMDCDDADSCTEDSCSDGACAHTAIPECCTVDTNCDDGNPCNGGETCMVDLSTCAPGEALTCDDQNDCTTDSCGADGCVYTPIAGCCVGNSDCDDGNYCNGAEICDSVSRTCQGGATPTCDDGDACTLDGCVDQQVCFSPSTPESCNCTHTAIANCCTNDGDCQDGDTCNGRETCSLATQRCQPATKTLCDDDDPCTTDACQPQTCPSPSVPSLCYCSHMAIQGCTP